MDRRLVTTAIAAITMAATGALAEVDTFSSGDRDHLIWEDGFEAGGWRAKKVSGSEEGQKDDAPIWYMSQMQGDYSGRVVNQPARAGDGALRLEWRRENVVKGNNTSKKAHLWAPRAPSPDVERWWGFSIYIPKDECATDSKAEIIVQWHGVPDFKLGEGYRNPIMTIGQRNGNLITAFKYDERRVTPDKWRDWDSTKTDLGPTPFDRWIDFVFHIKWGPTGGGLVEAWMDGKKVVDQHDVKVGFNDEFGPYLGIGVYKWPGTSDHEKRVIYYDEVRGATGEAEFDDVAPGKPGDRRLPEEQPQP